MIARLRRWREIRRCDGTLNADDPLVPVAQAGPSGILLAGSKARRLGIPASQATSPNSLPGKNYCREIWRCLLGDGRTPSLINRLQVGGRVSPD